MLAQMEKRAREMMNNDLPFGGLAIMSMVDFCQLPPVPPAEPLYSALIKSIIKPITLNSKSTSTGPKIEGAPLFATFIKIELTQQMRAANDPQHMAFLNELRSSSLDPNKRSLQNLRHLKFLTKQDIDNNSSWINALIVVTSNEQRYRINDQQSIALSRNNKCPRIIWFQEILGIVSSGIDTQQVNYLYATCPRFKGIFVEGASGFLMQNINPKRGLSNGTPITFHS